MNCTKCKRDDCELVDDYTCCDYDCRETVELDKWRQTMRKRAIKFGIKLVPIMEHKT